MTAQIVESKQLRKWGNGLGLHIPKSIANYLRLDAGENVRFTVNDDKSFTVEVTHEKIIIPRLSVADLTSDQDKPDGTVYDWGDPVGKEVAW